MFCPNCGKQINDGDKFCQNCGTNLSGEPVNNQPFNNNNSVNTYAPGEEEELLKAYIGKNYEKFITRNFNIMPMIFPCIYTIYRRCYLYFLIAVLITIIPGLGFLAYIIYAIVLGFCFNGWYLKKAKDEVSIIKHTHPSASLEELKTLAANSGGTNVVGAAIFGVLVSLVLIILGLFLFLLITGLRDMYNNTELSNLFEDGTSEELEEYDDGIIKGRLKDLYYTVPSDYSLEKYKKDQYGFYNYKYDLNSYCKVEMYHEGISMDDYMDSIEVDRSKWLEESINGNAYKTISIDETGDNNLPLTKVYYAINKYNETYIFYFTDYNDVNEKCTNIRNELMNSVSYNHSITSGVFDIT